MELRGLVYPTTILVGMKVAGCRQLTVTPYRPGSHGLSCL